jgi:hypothetical protein
VRGKLTTQVLDRLTKMVGPPIKVGGGAMIELPPGQTPFDAIAITKDGTFLAGRSQMVKERLADAWRAPARAANSNLAQVASVLDARPVFSVVLTMSPGARQTALSDFRGEKNFFTDVVTRHKLASFSVFHDGLGWAWVDSHKPGLEAMAHISDGMMDMLRASHIAPRAMAKIFMGVLESYRGNKQADELIKRKADLWKIVESYTGDGSFKVAIYKNPASLRLTARATGKSLSDVLPAALLLPVGMFVGIARESSSSSEAPAEIAAPPPPGASKAGAKSPPRQPIKQPVRPAPRP